MIFLFLFFCRCYITLILPKLFVRYLLKGFPFNVQSFWEITSDSYFEFIKKYVVGIGPWKDTIARPVKNYLTPPTDLVARAHAHDLQVCSL